MLRVEPTGPTYDAVSHGDVPLLDATATYDEESGAVTLFAVNRSVEEDLEVDVDLHAFPSHRIAGATMLAAPDSGTGATNTADRPDAVSPSDNPRVRLETGRLAVVLPPVSWNVVRLLPAASTPPARES